MNIIIVGAGQLGSRHLQSCLKLSQPSFIFVVDPDQNSLEISSQRAAEIGNVEHEVSYHTSLDDVETSELDFLVLATGAKIRLVVLADVLERFHVKYAILEKILFQDLASYDQARDVLEESSVTAFVNCPLRAYPFFKRLKADFVGEASNVRIKYTGGEWIGLACNSIHYIDLLNFFAEGEIASFDFSGLDKEIIPSKRPGYIEFTGKITVDLIGGGSLSVESIKGSEKASEIEIIADDTRIVIDELSGSYKLFNCGELVECSNYEVMYQSNLTHLIIEQILDANDCDLSPFELSAKLHLPFVSGLLSFYNEQSGDELSSLPIT